MRDTAAYLPSRWLMINPTVSHCMTEEYHGAWQPVLRYSVLSGHSSCQHFSEFCKSKLEINESLNWVSLSTGVATIVQGTIVQGDICPRDFFPMTQLSKETIVQWDFCPRKLLPGKSLLKLFFILYWILQFWLLKIYKKNNMNIPKCFKLLPWRNVCLDQYLLGQKSSWSNVLWTK